MTNTDTALAVVEQPAEASVIEWNLDSFPTDRFNRLIPTQVIAMPTDLFRPVVQVVQLDPPDRDGKSPDHYKSSDVPAGHRAPTARALSKFADAAGVSFIDERRTDDGSDPDVMGVSVTAVRMLPTGQRVTTPGSQLINLRTWFGSQTSDAEKAKFRKQFYAHVSTRARSRAIRGILSLRSSYPDADIAKPFAVVSYAPNMNHPEVRSRFLDAMTPMVGQLYGSQTPAAPQLVAGPAEISAPEAPEEDPAPATPTELPGESLAKAGPTSDDDLPDWATGGASAPAGDDAVDIVEALRAAAAASKLKGGLTDPQKAQIGPLLLPFNGTGAFGMVMREAFGPEAVQGATAAQGQAIITVASRFDSPELFVAAWGATADALKAAGD